MPDIELLLKPISEAKPSGDELKYTPLFDKIRLLRKLEDIGSKGSWESDSAGQDFGLIAKLASDALANKTKDLQLAAWLTEAWTYEEGVGGFISGVDLCREIILRFWDTLYPEIDDGDLELRATHIDWIGSYFDPAKSSSPILAIRSVSMTDEGYNWFVYQESRKIGYESEVNANPARKALRDAAVKDKKVTPEAFDKSFDNTKKAFYKELEANLKQAVVSINELDEVCHEKFQDVAPSFTPMRKAIEEVANVVHILLLKKLQKDPDPVVVEPVATPEATVVEEEAPVTHEEIKTQTVDMSGEIKSEDQAILHIVAAAQFMRKKNPTNPAPYLLLRALRWGELRAAGDIQRADLPAPLAETRRILRTAAAAGNWKLVLESAETAMGQACGRGWLDLQRYSIRACTELTFEAVAKALRSELRTLLLDFPALTKATLNDDTGAANPETIDWLRQEGLSN